MNPRLRLWGIGAQGATFAIFLSFGIAEESYGWAALSAGIIVWLGLEWWGGPRPEAWALAVAFVGYVLGNRGFAQISLSAQLPLLPAELALTAGLAATLLRGARRETPLIRRDALNLALLVWMAISTARLWTDFRQYGALALRDFAMVYYALFFFVAQALGRHAASAQLLRRAALVALTLLPAMFLLYSSFPDFFLTTLQIRGVPLVYYKEDLVAAYFFAGFYLIWTTRWPLVIRGTVALAGYAAALTISSSRAALMGLLAAGGWWALARRWTPWKAQALAVPLGLGILTVVALVRQEDFNQSRVYALYEQVMSIGDFSGTRHYTTDERTYVGDNNRFRLAWWRSVADDVATTSPVFGLGFGYDLAAHFVRSYELDLGDDFTARSPHSMLFSVLGRTGLAGLAAFLAVIGAIAAATWRAAKVARSDDSALPALGWWSVSWVMLVSGCFGVVLEGPMGAVVFWTALGLANSTTADLASTAPDRSAGPDSDSTVARSGGRDSSIAVSSLPTSPPSA